VTVLLDSLEVSLDGLLGLVVFLPPLGVLGECLLLSSLPVLVESPLDFIRDLLSPDGGQCPQTSGSLDVPDQSNDLHGGALDNSDWFDDVLLDDLLAFSLLVMSGNVGHAGLVADEGGQVDGSLDVVLGE